MAGAKVGNYTIETEVVPFCGNILEQDRADGIYVHVNPALHAGFARALCELVEPPEGTYPLDRQKFRQLTGMYSVFLFPHDGPNAEANADIVGEQVATLLRATGSTAVHAGTRAKEPV
jgi:hypothetical protein